MQVKYFTKKQLIKSNEDCITAEREKALDPEELSTALERAPKGVFLPVCTSVPKNDHEIRVQVAFSPTQTGWMDMSFEEFDDLSTADIPPNVMDFIEAEEGANTNFSLH